jgi:hypothetical protein
MVDLSNKEHSERQVDVACIAFLAMMRRQFVKEFPDKPCRIPSFENMDLKKKMFFRRAMKSSLKASTPESIAKLDARD